MYSYSILNLDTITTLVPVTPFESQSTLKSADLRFHKKLEALKAKNRYSYSHEDLSKTTPLDEGFIAAQDYRASNAGRMAKPVEADLVKPVLKGGHQHQFVSNASLKLSKVSSQSFSDISQSSNREHNKPTKHPPGTKVEANKFVTSNGNIPHKSVKKHPAPPPPPPPPLPTIYKGIT